MKKLCVVFLMLALMMMAGVTQVRADDSIAEVNVDTWNSPIKAILNDNHVILDGVDVQNQTYYVLYVTFDKMLNLENEAYFTNLVQNIAKANQYQSFQIDDSNGITIEVTCQNGAVSEVIYNQKKDFFQYLKEFQAKEKQLVAYLWQQVPELKDLQAMVTKADGEKAQLNVYVDSEPMANVTDKYAREYYVLNVDEQKSAETRNLDQFLVQKDLQEIVWYDPDSDKYLSLEEWRKASAAAPYWPDMFK